MNATLIRRAMHDAVGAAFPGAVLRVAVDGSEVFHEGFGRAGVLERSPAVTTALRWDIASLTKPLCVMSLAMQGVDEGWLDLDEPVLRRLPDLERDARHVLTPRLLLCHRSGLPDWRPYMDWLQERHPEEPPGSPAAVARVRSWVTREPLVAPPGAVERYSDLGYMLLGWWIEDALGEHLDVAFQRRVATPLGLRSTAYVPVSGWEARGALRHTSTIAPTEQCSFRGRLLVGEVHDENAFALGGVAGHAGLFSTAQDVGRWADALLASLNGRGLWSVRTVREFLLVDGSLLGSTWRLGMDSPSPGASSAGQRVSRSALGHLGFTGCSVWIDPPRRATVVLLSNRVHPTRLNEAIRTLRPQLHDLIWFALDGRAAPPDAPLA